MRIQRWSCSNQISEPKMPLTLQHLMSRIEIYWSCHLMLSITTLEHCRLDHHSQMELDILMDEWTILSSHYNVTRPFYSTNNITSRVFVKFTESILLFCSDPLPAVRHFTLLFQTCSWVALSQGIMFYMSQILINHCCRCSILKRLASFYLQF